MFLRCRNKNFFEKLIHLQPDCEGKLHVWLCNIGKTVSSQMLMLSKMLRMWRGSRWGGSVGLEEFLNFVPVNSFLKLFVLYFNCVAEKWCQCFQETWARSSNHSIDKCLLETPSLHLAFKTKAG